MDGELQLLQVRFFGILEILYKIRILTDYYGLVGEVVVLIELYNFY